MPLEGLEQLGRGDATPVPAHVDIPGLVIDPRADDIDVALGLGPEGLKAICKWP